MSTTQVSRHRALQALEMGAQGRSVAEIADDLSVTVGTVRKYMKECRRTELLLQWLYQRHPFLLNYKLMKIGVHLEIDWPVWATDGEKQEVLQKHTSHPDYRRRLRRSNQHRRFNLDGTLPDIEHNRRAAIIKEKRREKYQRLTLASEKTLKAWSDDDVRSYYDVLKGQLRYIRQRLYGRETPIQSKKKKSIKHRIESKGRVMPEERDLIAIGDYIAQVFDPELHKRTQARVAAESAREAEAGRKILKLKPRAVAA